MTTSSEVALLPSTYQALAPQAVEYSLACVQLPKDEDDMQSAVHEFCVEILNKQCLLNVEYKNAGVDCVTLCHADSKDDVAQLLLTEGWLLVEARREKRLAKLVGQYQKAQEKAKEGRKNLWKYGDFREDEDKEFGYRP